MYFPYVFRTMLALDKCKIHRIKWANRVWSFSLSVNWSLRRNHIIWRPSTQYWTHMHANPLGIHCHWNLNSTFQAKMLLLLWNEKQMVDTRADQTQRIVFSISFLLPFEYAIKQYMLLWCVCAHTKHTIIDECKQMGKWNLTKEWKKATTARKTMCTALNRAQC